MSKASSRRTASPLLNALRKAFVSAFVVISFAAYVVHQRLVSSDPATASTQNQPATALPSTLPTPTSLPPTAVPLQQGQYRDGIYAGPSADAFYGLVQVQATIQNGKITDVEFLQYPHDRRTSQRINQQAMPYLIQEAIQAQKTPTNAITGATLTSQAFEQSLDAALTQAKNPV